MDPKMNERDMDPAAWAKWSEASGAKPVKFDMERAAQERYATIDYMISPKCFVLRVPVEALANLTEDAHTRMLRMLGDWISDNRPPRTRDEKVSKP